MTAPDPLPNELVRIHAYADRRLDAADAASVEQRLADDAEAERRVADYRRIDAALRTLYGPVADEPVPPRLIGALYARSGGWRRAAAAALAGVTLLLGASGGWWLRGAVQPVATTAAPAFAERALVAHLVYVPEVRHPVEVGVDQRDHLVRWLSNRLGTPLPAPDLAGEGFSMVGGRLLPGESGPAAQLMYQSAAGERVTLYYRRSQRGEHGTAFRYQEQPDGTRAVWWIDGPLGCVLAGALPRDRLERLAHLVYAQIRP